jgi:PAS domain S-box-containing protein
MSAAPHSLRTSTADEIAQRVATRAPLGFAVFLACLALSAGFEFVRFPARRPLMAALAIGLTALVASCRLVIRRWPRASVPAMIVFVNVSGVAINAYHVLAGAPLGMSVWPITALLASSALVLAWGSRNQLLASAGAILSFPLHLTAVPADPLAWAAGGAYLLVVVVLSTSGASVLSRYLRDRARLSAALTEREARLQSYFDLSLVGCAILDAGGVCGEVNDELARMLGRSREEILGTPWASLVHQQERELCEALLARVTSAGGQPERVDLRCVRSNGEVIHAIVSVRGLPAPDGSRDHVMVLVQDITERKRAEVDRERYIVRVETEREQAEATNRAKDEFLATISHELKTPLTPILGWSTLLRRGGLSAEKAAAAAAAIERNAKSQAQLIDDLLDFSRIVVGKWRLDLAAMDLAPVIRAAVDVILGAAEARGVTLAVALPPREVIVRGDRQRLQQVVWNLLSNAVKFTPAGGRVDVELECGGGQARIIVRDTGEGVAPEFLPHIFEQFRQADGSTSRRHGGLGLGLAIVRVLVELHGGSVRAASSGLGLGSTFTIELPLWAEASDAPCASADKDVLASIREGSLGGLRVLVVDDDRDATMLMGALFASCGAEVRLAHSAREALEIADAWSPDVLVSDLAMPGEDGYALLAALRARGGSLAHVPAVAVTAHAGSLERLFTAGFESQIVKPFDPGELAAAVERAAAASARRAMS